MTLTPFPRLRTNVGTLMCVGVSPSAKPFETSSYKGFATFEKAGRLEHYLVRTAGDMNYLMQVFNNRPYLNKLYEGSIDRRDLEIGSLAASNRLDPKARTIDIYEPFESQMRLVLADELPAMAEAHPPDAETYAPVGWGS